MHACTISPLPTQTMEIQVIDQQLVLPLSTPFTSDHTLPLSHLDNDPNLNTTFRYLRAYSAPPAVRESDNINTGPFIVIATALSKVLVHYSPLAGILRRQNNEGRLELHCNAGKGVPLIHAKVPCRLDTLNYLENTDSGFVERLVPDPDRNNGMTHPCMLQVTEFACGGFVLGAGIHHAVCDGMGASLFFNAMAEFARNGSDRIQVKPVWNRDVLLGPRVPPRVVAPVSEFLMVDKEVPPYGQLVGEVVRECFGVKNEVVERFRGEVLEKCGMRFTTFEALGAYIWRAKVKACEIGSDEKVKFAYSINIRKLVKPPLPQGYWGNGCVPICVQLSAKEVIEKPIWETAQLIKKSKSRDIDEYVHSFIDFQEIYHEKGITAGNEVTGFTDWRHLGHNTVDFGWGGPVTVLPLSRHLIGSVEPCFFLPSASSAGNSGNDGFKVLVNLRKTAMPAFMNCMEKFCKKEFELP